MLTARSARRSYFGDTLFVRVSLCEGGDSNPWTPSGAGLKPAAFGRSATLAHFDDETARGMSLTVRQDFRTRIIAVEITCSSPQWITVASGPFAIATRGLLRSLLAIVETFTPLVSPYSRLAPLAVRGFGEFLSFDHPVRGRGVSNRDAFANIGRRPSIGICIAGPLRYRMLNPPLLAALPPVRITV